MQAKAMSGCLSGITGIVLIASVAAATAAPLVPSGDLPGRERYRFTPSPLASSRSCAGTAVHAGDRDRRARGAIGTVEIVSGGAADDRRDHRGSSVGIIGALG